jgi:hypothetical protein
MLEMAGVSARLRFASAETVQPRRRTLICCESGGDPFMKG